MSKWLVKLTGNDFDLRALVQLNAEPEYSVTEEDGDYYLSCDEFNRMQEAGDVYAAATEELLPDINSLMKLRDPEAQPVSLDSVIRLNDNGSRTVSRYVFGSASIASNSRVAVQGHVVSPDGTVVPSSEAVVFQARRKLARTNTAVHQALAYWRACDAADSNVWVNAYKVYEIIREDMAGGRDKGQGTEEMKRSGWATQSEIRNFKASANNHAISGRKARHAENQLLEPGIVPLREGDALALVKRLLEHWLDWKIAQSGTTTP